MAGGKVSFFTSSYTVMVSSLPVWSTVATQTALHRGSQLCLRSLTIELADAKLSSYSVFPMSLRKCGPSTSLCNVAMPFAFCGYQCYASTPWSCQKSHGCVGSELTGMHTAHCPVVLTFNSQTCHAATL